MKDNQGFTLIEVIIIIVIVGFISIGSMLGADLFGFGKTKSTVSKIDAMLDYVQIENRTKNEPYEMVITETNDRYILSMMRKNGTDWVSETSEKLDLRKGEINFLNKDGSYYLISETDEAGREERSSCNITFSKETGGVQRNELNEIVTDIIVTGDGISYTIHLVEATGKHYIE